MSFSAMTCFDSWLVAAVYRFYGLEVDVATAEAEILEDEGERIRFFPWFLWDFRADDATETIGERFVAEAELPPHERELAQALVASYVGFFEVTARHETSVDLLDLATQLPVRIPDEALAADVKSGQLVHGRVVHVGPDEGLIDAIYAVLPSDAKPAVLLELETLVGDGGRPDLVLKSYAPEMLDFSDHLLDALTQPPTAENRDGDELTLTRQTLSGPLLARLRVALADAPADDLTLVADDLWMWTGPELEHGLIDLRGAAALLANSPRRHDALCARVEELLGEALPGLKQLEDFSRAVQRWVERGGGEPWLSYDPEVREAVRGWFASWARQWLDMPLAALSERTPREAARDAQGRARVLGLVERFETVLRGELGAIGGFSLEALRSELGL
ncbi:MAG: DUF2384 domain-containing protein [Myxococcales bacterium]|nr:DUF2384 domain-containing protein [Myxococcales bacterium]MCB9731130.1 DUF2384 domain-containing protein [Deltaproteobacteria bacterium]